MPTRVFLSYGRDDDEPFVWRLYEALKVAPGPDGPLFDVWFDRVCMPSRGVPFLQEVRDTIATTDRLVLLVGPDAMASDYVRQEWRQRWVAGHSTTAMDWRALMAGSP
jgi:hypothetical protein